MAPSSTRNSKVIEERKAEFDEARALLLTVKSRIDRGEPVDAATFCSLIRQGDKIMEPQDWKKVTDRYFSPEEQARWAETMKDAPADFDQAEYSRKWKDLGDRVEAAIPLRTGQRGSAGALRRMAGAAGAVHGGRDAGDDGRARPRLYERMDEWHGDVPQAPFTPEAFKFIQEIGRGRAGR